MDLQASEANAFSLTKELNWIFQVVAKRQELDQQPDANPYDLFAIAPPDLTKDQSHYAFSFRNTSPLLLNDLSWRCH